jgi:hypothetical protein
MTQPRQFSRCLRHRMPMLFSKLLGRAEQISVIFRACTARRQFIGLVLCVTAMPCSAGYCNPSLHGCGRNTRGGDRCRARGSGITGVFSQADTSLTTPATNAFLHMRPWRRFPLALIGRRPCVYPIIGEPIRACLVVAPASTLAS